MSDIKIFVTTAPVGTMALEGAVAVPYATMRSAEALRYVAENASGEYTVIYTKNLPLQMGLFAIERMTAVAEDTGADMVYADHYKIIGGQKRRHPLIECQRGALRDDFDFGSVLMFRTSSFVKAVGAMTSDWQWGALYDVRLRMEKIVHVNEPLYTEHELDIRKSGEKQFDYVDPRNRQVQVEMEKICTEHLKRIGGFLEPRFKEPDAGEFGGAEFSVTATVVIPVFNRIRTVKDAVESALGQE